MRSKSESSNYRVKLRYLASVTLFLVTTFIIISFPSARAYSVNQSNRSQVNSAILGDKITVRAAGRGRPWLNLRNGHDLITTYGDQASATQFLKDEQINPRALAAGDFDEDGVPDLVSACGGSSRGTVTIHRGNVDSIHPYSADAQRRRAESTTRVPGDQAPFLSPGEVFDLPEPPDLIEAGDFDADGHCDLVTAARLSQTVYLLPGDGRGILGPAQAFVMPGNVVTLTAGEVNRADGLADLVVGIDGIQGPELLVFEGPYGAAKAQPEVFALPAQPNEVILGHLNRDANADIAIATGSQLMIVRGRDRKLSLDAQSRAAVENARISRLSFQTSLTSLAIGDFAGDSELDLAAMTDDGTIHLVKQMADGRRRTWKSETLATNFGPGTSNLICARLSSLSHETLVVVNRAQRKLQIWMNEAERRERGDVTLAAAPATLDVEGEPIAVLPMRLNADALSDLAILRSGDNRPSFVMTQSNTPITVCNQGDCTNCGSLRDAIDQANQTGGLDAIVFDDQLNGVPTFNLQSSLPAITEAVTLNGLALGSCSGSLVAPSDVTPHALQGIGLDGGNSVTTAFTVTGGGSNIENFVINRFGAAVRLQQARGNIIQSNIIGLAADGNTSIGNAVGVRMTTGGNTIGGTIPSEGNNISRNQNGVEIEGPAATDNVLRNNVIGFNAALNSLRGNSAFGVAILNGATRNTVGGSFVGTRNVIFGSGLDGVIISVANGNNVQRNQIGQHGRNGVSVASSANSLIGGTNDIVRNDIFLCAANGVELNGSTATNNLVQGNRIGAGVDNLGNFTNLGNGVHGVACSLNASGNFIGGAAAAAGNIIAFNRNDGVSVVSGNGNQILSNRLFSNTDLGIDLGNNGPTLNDDKDPDSGPNDFQNFPVLTSATFSATAARLPSDGAITSNSITPHAAGLTVVVTFNSTPSQSFILDFFFGANCQGQGSQTLNSIPIPLGQRPATTDANGNFSGSFVFAFTPPVANGFVNATATKVNNSTSELSQCIQIGTATCLLTCPANQTVTAASPAGAVVAYAPPTTSGNCTGAGAPSCVPASGSTFAVGTTTVNCSVSDAGGIRGSCSFTVTVTALAGPSITEVFRDAKHLIVLGAGFGSGAKIIVDGVDRATVLESTTRLKGKKLYKKLSPGQHAVQVRSNGVTSLAFSFTK